MKSHYIETKQLSELVNKQCKDIITGSNNILAIEYIKVILCNKLNMTYYPVLREGAGYNDDTDNAKYASAFGIRKMLMSDEAEKLNTDSYQDQIAYAIYEGILYYFDNPDMEVE